MISPRQIFDFEDQVSTVSQTGSRWVAVTSQFGKGVAVRAHELSGVFDDIGEIRAISSATVFGMMKPIEPPIQRTLLF